MSPKARVVRVPQCLSHLASEKRWVAWRWETRNGKPTKPPLRALGGRVGGYAHNDKPETWATLAEAETAYAAGGCDGIGLQLLGLNGFAAIDLDDVRNETGKYTPWAWCVIENAGSYVEHTPSGKGGRILGHVPEDYPTFHTRISHPEGGHFELYANLTASSGRYITVTGDQIEAVYDQLLDISTTVTALSKLGEKKADTDDDTSSGPSFDDTCAFNALPDWVQDHVQHGGSGDRSADFQSVVNALRPRGWTFAAALKLFQDNPNGPAAKYVKDKRLERELRRSWNKAKAPGSAETDVGATEADLDPVDLWGVFPPPDLPRGLLPPVIEEFAFVLGDQMGADPAGLAMAALCTCAAAIPDWIKLKVKRHDTWYESARIWVALVGSPSTKKSPILNAASAPIRAIDHRMVEQWKKEVAIFFALPKEERLDEAPPPQKRVRIEDTTIEAAQQVLEGSPDGILCYQDELSGFFGAMDKYNGGKGSSADRAFWLKAFNGGEYALNRVGRGVVLIPNLSVCLLGGIQPDPIRKLAADSQDDGLLQRLFPIVLKHASLGKDEPKPNVARAYADIVDALHLLERPGFFGIEDLTFEDGAQEIRFELEAKHLALQSTEVVSPKLASHIAKYDGLFARLCIIWHCVEHVTSALGVAELGQQVELSSVVTTSIARRVADFLHGFLLPHAVAFYGGILGLSDDHDRLAAIAGHILTQKLQKVTHRDVQRGNRAMRAIRDVDIRPLLEQLAALGWLVRVDAPRPSSQAHWLVNNAVHTKFADRAKTEAARRDQARKTIAAVLGGAR